MTGEAKCRDNENDRAPSAGPNGGLTDEDERRVGNRIARTQGEFVEMALELPHAVHALAAMAPADSPTRLAREIRFYRNRQSRPALRLADAVHATIASGELIDNEPVSSPWRERLQRAARAQRLNPRAALVLAEAILAHTGTINRPARDAYAQWRAAINELVEANQGLIHACLHRMPQPPGEPEDLVAEGQLGLIRAAERFEPARGTRFSTSAMNWIRSSIDRGSERCHDTVRKPSYLHEREHKVRRAAAELYSANQRLPKPAEIARHTGVKEEVVLGALRGDGPTVSLDAPYDEQEGDSNTMGSFLEDERAGPLDSAEAGQLQEVIEEALQWIPRTHAEAIRLYTGVGTGRQGGMPMGDVAERLGYCRWHTTRLYHEGLKQLRTRLSTTMQPYEQESHLA